MQIKRIVALALSFSILLGTTAAAGVVPAQAATKVLRLAQARNMAIASSPEISKKQNELILTQMRYTESVDGITAKIKNKQTFRWSPFLSFKFPEPLAMVDEYDMKVKPLVLQNDITVARHNLRDLQYEMLGKVSNQYVKVYTTQEKLTFAEEKMKIAQQQLTRNKARLLVGQATQTDIDNMNKSVDKLTQELSTLGREFEAGKKELGDIIKLDVSSGYTFQNPMQELNLPRSELQTVIDYTLANDQGYYEAVKASSVALMNLDAYVNLINGKNYSEMSRIRPYISAVKQGKDVDYAAFKIDYKQMLNEMDDPWEGMWGWWFFKFPMEWFKGDIDGTRYIEDEMYAPYTACMEYSNAVKAEKSARKALTKQVEGDYNTLVSAYNSYRSFEKSTELAGQRQLRTAELNRQGKAEFSELQEALDSYQSTQMDTLDALTSYNELLNSFDRLTCGIVSRYLSGVALGNNAGQGGDSYVIKDLATSPYYYIYTSVQDWTFQVGVGIPDNFVPVINQFELWLGDIQIGTRTDIKQPIRHLSLDYGGDPMLTIKLFNNDNFVAQSIVDAQIPHGVLDLEGTVAPPPTHRVIGSYTVEDGLDDEVTTSTLTLTLDAAVGAKSYNLTYSDSGSVYTGEHLAIDMPFNYLSILITSLETITLELFDKDGKLIYEAGFDTAEGTITVPIDTVGGAP